MRRRYYQPSVWQSHDHLYLWLQFLRDRLKADQLTYKKFRNKVRRAWDTFDDQVRRWGGTPEQQRGIPDSSEHLLQLAREIARKGADGR